jgi:hypothetical protein
VITSVYAHTHTYIYTHTPTQYMYVYIKCINTQDFKKIILDDPSVITRAIDAPTGNTLLHWAALNGQKVRDKIYSLYVCACF